MYIFRTLFWISVIVFLLPGEEPANENASTTSAPSTSVSVTEAVSATLSTIGDVAGLCARQPEVCDTGSAAWQVFQRKAKYGVNLLYDWTAGDTPENTGEAPAAAQSEAARSEAALSSEGRYRISDNSQPVHTGSADQPAQAPASDQPSSQNTLRLEDLIPEWSGPSSQRA